MPLAPIHLHEIQLQGVPRKVLYSSQKAQFSVELQHNKVCAEVKIRTVIEGMASVLFWEYGSYQSYKGGGYWS